MGKIMPAQKYCSELIVMIYFNVLLPSHTQGSSLIFSKCLLLDEAFDTKWKLSARGGTTQSCHQPLMPQGECPSFQPSWLDGEREKGS